MGKYLFSQLFCLKAPYFRTISPIVNDMKAGHGESCRSFFIFRAEGFSYFWLVALPTASVSLKQKWSLQNHIQTVHAIAVCNLVEMAMGLVAEATIPSHLRWLPMGMDVNYKKKATGRLTAVSDINPDTFFKLDKYPGMVKVPVIVTNAEGVEVTTAEVSSQ
jgi:hypothetical protein